MRRKPFGSSGHWVFLDSFYFEANTGVLEAKVGATLMILRPNLTLFLVCSDPPGAGIVALTLQEWHAGQSKSNLGKSGMLIA